MSAQGQVIFFDGATTPVSHTFKADGVNRVGDLVTANWKETNANVPDYSQVRFVQTRQKLRSGTLKMVSRFEVPVMESVAGQNAAGYTAAPKVAFTDRAELVTYSSPRSTATGKRICYQMLVNAMNDVHVTSVIATTGYVPELHQAGLICT